jgi:transmembrane sensor
VKNDFDDSVKELITKHLAGEASSEEETALRDWIAEAQENERHYLAYKKVFEISENHYAHQAEAMHTVDIDHEWNHFITTIQRNEGKPEAKLRSIEKSPLNFWYKIAAAIALVAVSGWIILNFISGDNTIHYETASETRTISLPDGSQVTLNSHSELSYSSSFNEKDRTVTLQGEAFFEVTRNPQKTFRIHANSAVVEVLGTSFNVLAYDSLAQVEVVVETGTVKLSVPDSKTEVKLVAGEKGIYSKGSQQVSSSINKDVNFQSWNTRKIIFTEDDLRAVVETLNKIYRANITIAADVPASCVVTVTFDHQSLDAVLHVLETTLNLTYQVNGNQIVITAAGC